MLVDVTESKLDIHPLENLSLRRVKVDHLRIVMKGLKLLTVIESRISPGFKRVVAFVFMLIVMVLTYY